MTLGPPDLPRWVQQALAHPNGTFPGAYRMEATFRSEPQRIAADPNSTAEQLLQLVTICPAEMLLSPALSVLSLSEPALWKRITRSCHRRLAEQMLTCRAGQTHAARESLELLTLARAEPALKRVFPPAEVDHALGLVREPQRLHAFSHFNDALYDMLTINDWAMQGGGSPEKIGGRLLVSALGRRHRHEHSDGLRDTFSLAVAFAGTFMRHDLEAVADAELLEVQAQAGDLHGHWLAHMLASP